MATCSVTQFAESGLDGTTTERSVLMKNSTLFAAKAGLRGAGFLCVLALAGQVPRTQP